MHKKNLLILLTMAEFKICEQCNSLVEYKPETQYEGGISYTVFKCPKCNYIKKSNINHIHYGMDGKK